MAMGRAFAADKPTERIARASAIEILTPIKTQPMVTQVITLI
jgi:hypothetical protein